MRVTQLDIAKAANVSQATVSRVLAGDERVETTMRDRVMNAIESHNYRPDARARSLRKKRAGLIGLAVQRPSGGLADDPFFTALVADIADALTDTEFRLTLEVISDHQDQVDVYDELLRSRRVDGMILVESELNDRRLHLLQEDQFPFVLIGNPGGQPVWSVDNDNIYAAQIATQHLVDMGYQRVAMIAGRQGVTVSDDREEGYRRVMRAHECAPMVFHADFGAENARCAAAMALAEHRPDAFVVLDDFMAMGVINAVHRAGLRCPQDVGIVSFNDSRLCDLTAPGLSSVSLNLDRLVQKAVGCLLTMLDEPDQHEPVREIVPCTLRVRGSSRLNHGGMA